MTAVVSDRPDSQHLLIQVKSVSKKSPNNLPTAGNASWEAMGGVRDVQIVCPSRQFLGFDSTIRNNQLQEAKKRKE